MKMLQFRIVVHKFLQVAIYLRQIYNRIVEIYILKDI